METLSLTADSPCVRLDQDFFHAIALYAPLDADPQVHSTFDVFSDPKFSINITV